MQVCMYALRVQIECAGAGKPCLRHNLGSESSVDSLGALPGTPKKDAVFFWGGIGGAVERSETEGVILLYLPQRGILLAEEIMIRKNLFAVLTGGGCRPSSLLCGGLL